MLVLGDQQFTEASFQVKYTIKIKMHECCQIEKTQGLRVGEGNSSVQQQITISHLPEHPKDHLELLWKKAISYSFVSPTYIEIRVLIVKFISENVSPNKSAICLQYGPFPPTAFIVRNTFK